MIPDDIRKLLGGYATGTLTGEERTLLFSAALEDQELFDALADEEALRELLAEPNTKQKLLEKLEQQPVFGQTPQPWREANDYAAMPLAGAAPTESIMPASPVAMQKTSAPSNFFSTRRFAFVGALVMVVLVAVGVRYLSREKDNQIVAMNGTEVPRNPEVAPPAVSDQPVAGQSAPKEKSLTRERSSTKDAVSIAASQAPAQLSDSRTGARLDAGSPAASSSNATRDATEVKEKAEKDSEFRQQFKAAQAPAPAPPPPAAVAGVAQESARRVEPAAAAPAEVRPAAPQVAKDQAPQVSQAAPVLETNRSPGAGLNASRSRSAPAATRETMAKVTDLNGTIISIDAGTNSGLKVGDTVEIVRNNRVIATTKLTQVGNTFAAGPYQPAAVNPATPRSGDLVRRPQ